MSLTLTPAEILPGDRIEVAVGVTRTVARVGSRYGTYRIHYEDTTYFDTKYAGNLVEVERDEAQTDNDDEVQDAAARREAELDATPA